MKAKVLCIMAFIICFMTVTALAAPPIKVVVGGEKLETDVAPIIVDGRTMLPVRAVFEAIGAKVNYEASERKVIATKGDTTVTFVIDSNIMTINGAEKTIDVPAMIKDNRTLVPLRACAEAFDLDVTWNNDTRTARVKIPVSVPVEHYIEHTSYVYEYDSNGNLTYSGNEYDWTKYLYDENGNLLYKETDNGDVEQYTYNNYGDVTSEHHYSNYEENVYDSEYGNASYNTYEYDYDENGNCIYFVPSGTNYGNGHWTKRIYDEHNNITYMESATGAWEKHIYTYDNSGNILYDEWTDCYGYSSSVRSGWKKYEYDANGNKIYYQDSSGFIDKWTYDERNNLIYYEGPGEGEGSMSQIYYEKYEYDANGNKIYKETTWFYNGQPTVTTTVWKYDSDGNLTYYEHNNFGNDPYTDWEKYTYDNSGNVICKESLKGRDGNKNINKTIYEYDSNNNLIYEETSYENSFYSNPYKKYKVIMK